MKENNHGYTHFRVAVPAVYEEVFSHVYVAENKSAETVTKTLLPSYQTILIFNFGDKARIQSRQNTQIEVDRCVILGPVRQAFNYSLPPHAEIITVNFKEDAFFRFFGNAAIAEHQPVHPDGLLSKDCFTVLWYELNEISNTKDRVNHILAFCKPYLQHRNKIAGQLANFKEPSLNPIKSVARQNCQSERNIQLSHKKHFGYSAKELNRYQRFLKAIELIQYPALKATRIDWFEIISECGYYDQSQLVHDFKHYLNLSPAKYLKSQQDICNPIT